MMRWVGSQQQGRDVAGVVGIVCGSLGLAFSEDFMDDLMKSFSAFPMSLDEPTIFMKETKLLSVFT